MKTSIKLIFLTAVTLFLAACQTPPATPEPVIEYKTRTLLAVIPEHLLPNCIQPSPPKQDPYVNALPAERERQMTDYIQSLHMAITNCNNTIDSARIWNSRQKNLFLKRPATEIINLE